MIDTNTAEYKKRQKLFTEQNPRASGYNSTNKSITKLDTKLDTSLDTQQYTDTRGAILAGKLPQVSQPQQALTVPQPQIQPQLQAQAQPQIQPQQQFQQQREQQNTQIKNRIENNLNNFITAGNNIEKAKEWGLSGKLPGSDEYNMVVDWYSQQINKQYTTEAKNAVYSFNSHFVDRYNPTGIQDIGRWENKYIELRKKGLDDKSATIILEKEARIARNNANNEREKRELERLNSNNQFNERMASNLDNNRVEAREKYTKEAEDKVNDLKGQMDKFIDLSSKDPVQAKNAWENLAFTSLKQGVTSSQVKAFQDIQTSLYSQLGISDVSLSQDILSSQSRLKTIENQAQSIEENIRKTYPAEKESTIQALVAERTKDIKYNYDLEMDKMDLLQGQVKNIEALTQNRIANWQADRTFAISLIKDTNNFVNGILDGKIKETPEGIVSKINDYVVGGLNNPAYWEDRASELIDEGYSVVATERMLNNEMSVMRTKAGEVYMTARNDLEKQLLMNRMQTEYELAGQLDTNIEQRLPVKVEEFQFLTKELGLDPSTALKFSGFNKEEKAEVLNLDLDKKLSLELKLADRVQNNKAFAIYRRTASKALDINTAYQDYLDKKANGIYDSSLAPHVSTVLISYFTSLEDSAFMQGEMDRETHLGTVYEQTLSKIKNFSSSSPIPENQLEAYISLANLIKNSHKIDIETQLSPIVNSIKNYGVDPRNILPEDLLYLAEEDDNLSNIINK